MAAQDEGTADGPGRLRMDVFDEGDIEAVVPTGVGDLGLLISGWMESHSPEGGRGAHLAVRQAWRQAAPPLVVHVSRVPALVAALTEMALRLTQLWERDGEQYWAVQPAPGGTGPQDPGGAAVPAVPREVVSDEARRQRRRDKAALFDLVHDHAQEVLSAVLAAEDDEDAATALSALLGIPPESALELVTHLQFRELTRSSRRRQHLQAQGQE